MKNLFILFSGLLLLNCNDTLPVSDTETIDIEQLSITKSEELIKLEEFIIANPNSEKGYVDRANYYLGTGDYELALKDANKALKVKPNDADVNFLKGYTYLKLSKIDMNQLDKAFPFLERTLEIDSMHTNGNLELAYYFIAGKNFEPALDLINRVIKKDKFLARPYYLKGMWYEKQGMNALAISSFQTAVERNPNYYESYLALGSIHDKMNNPLAIQYFNSALAVFPRSIEVWRLKGMSFYEHDQYEDAIVCFDNILSIDSTFEVAHYDIGSSLLKLCYNDNPKPKNDSLIVEALVQFNKALELNSNYIDAIYNRALCYEAQGQRTLATREYKRILTIEENYSMAIEALNNPMR